MSNRVKTSILPLGDLHVGAKTFNDELFERWLKDAKNCCKHGKRKGKGYILLNGDLCDFARASQDAWSSTMSATEQIDFVVDALEPFKDNIIGSTVSNHECFDEKTELLTVDGWKFIKDCDDSTIFGTINPETHDFEYQKSLKTYKQDYKGKMIEYENRSVSFKTTPNHRFVYKPHSKNSIWKIGELPEYTEVDLLLAGFNDLLESDDLSDNEIRLIAWCLTDAHRDKYGCWSFFQSEPKNNRLEELLNSFGFEYNKYIHSNKGDVNGINQQGSPIIARHTGYTYDLKKEYSVKIDNLCDNHNIIPESVFKLDERQFNIFLKEVVFCDGSFHNNSFVVYKSKEFLDQLQILCLKNGYRTILKEYRPNHWRLCIHKRNNVRIHLKDIKYVDYDGLIFCATVPNDTLISRRNGKVLITGNSRAHREFNLDVGQEIANRLEIPHSIDLFYDVEYAKGQYKRIFAKHGTRFSKSYLLFMRNFINDMNNIEADTFIIGHSHFLGAQTRIVRTATGINKKHYVVNGAFLDYLGSYAQKSGYDLRLAGYPIVTIDSDGEFDFTLRWAE